jgi:hypothetical protein
VKAIALRQNPNDPIEEPLNDHGNAGRAEGKFLPTNVVSQLHGMSSIPLRMFTEEEVAGILQVSLSQLRKWRMKHQPGAHQGPPFKKVGRLVRYPQRALQAYIDGD